MSILQKIIDRNNNYSIDNYLINGDIALSQRGDYSSPTSATHLTYYADRYQAMIVDLTAQIQVLSSNQPDALNSSNSYKIIATSSATGKIGFRQQVEFYYDLKNRTVTAAAWVRSNNSNARVGIFDGTNIHYSNAHSGNGLWELLIVTIDLIAAPTAVAAYIMTATAANESVTVTSGDYVEFSGHNLKLGYYAPFQRRNFSEELLLAKRYFEKSYAVNTAPGTAGSNAGAYQSLHNVTAKRDFIKFTVEKRTIPTIRSYSPDTGAGPDKIRNRSTATDLFFVLGDNGTTGYNISITGVASQQYAWHWSAESELS